MPNLQDLLQYGDRDALNAYLNAGTLQTDTPNRLNALVQDTQPLTPEQRVAMLQAPLDAMRSKTRNLGFVGDAGDLLNQNADQTPQVPKPAITNATLNADPMIQAMRRQEQARQQAIAAYQAKQAAIQQAQNPLNLPPWLDPNKMPLPRNEAERQQQIDAIMKRRMVEAQINNLRSEAQARTSMDIKPKYEPSNNSFIIPPDAQHPNGQVIPAGQGMTGQSLNGLTGNEFLTSLPKPQADQIKALAEGRMAFPAGFALKSPYWQDMISKVSQYDPTFDAVNYNARAQTRQDFTKGASANNVTALNTAIQHLGKLSDAYNQLSNTSYPTINTAVNYLGNQLGNQNIQKNYAAVSTDATAVAHELAKVFRQSGMSEAEIRDWQDKISPNASPAQSKQVIQSAIDLMQGRLEALGARYNLGMGTTEQPYQLLTPEARKTWTRLSGSQPESNNQSFGNIKVINGKTYVNINGQWHEGG